MSFMYVVFFFFKQKTAYEIPKRDWSSDVCSSDLNANAGAAWVFTRTAGVWSQQGAKLVGTGAVGAAEQGLSVSLSADGNTAVVGGSRDDSGEGAAWVYNRTGSVWGQQGAKLVGTTAALSTTAQGGSVWLSADGNTAVVGGASDNPGAGAAWVFTRVDRKSTRLNS